MNRQRILIAEDQPEVAEQLEQLLSDDFDVIAVVADGVSLVDAALRATPDVIVTDIAMPGMNGLDAAERVLEARPFVRVVYVTVHDESALVERASRTSQCAYVLKDSAGEELVAAVKAVLRGESFLSAAIARAARHAPH